VIWGALPLAWKAGAIALAVLAVTGGIGGCVLKIKHDTLAVERAKVEREKQDAIDVANKAKSRLRQLCDRSPAECVSDDWFRD